MLVELAAEGEGNEVALKRVESLPRLGLIADLSRIREGLEEDNRLRVQIAFLFCYLDHEYASNRSVIVDIVSKRLRYKGFYTDDALVMLGTLIRRGDKELLKVVLQGALQADTAPAEAIGGIIEEQIRSDPASFLFSLRDQPAQVRRDVYRLIDLSDDTSNKFKRYLLAASSRREISPVAKELLEVLRAKARQRK